MEKISVSIKDLQQDEYTRFQCMYGCSSFKKHPLCPPACPDYGWYSKLLNSYNYAMICYEFICPESVHDLQKQRFNFQSSLVEEEFRLKREGYFYALSFTSGACILCGERSCSKTECNRKTVGRSPICSTGLNLSKLLVDIVGLSNQEALRYWGFLGKNLDERNRLEGLNVGLILY